MLILAAVRVRAACTDQRLAPARHRDDREGRGGLGAREWRIGIVLRAPVDAACNQRAGLSPQWAAIDYVEHSPGLVIAKVALAQVGGITRGFCAGS